MGLQHFPKLVNCKTDIVQNAFQRAAFDDLAAVARDNRVTPIGRTPPHFMTAFRLAIELESKGLKHTNDLTVGYRRKPFGHNLLRSDRNTACDDQMPVNLRNRRVGKIQFLIGLQHHPNGVFQILHCFGVGGTFNVAPLENGTFGVIATFFHTFEKYGIEQSFHAGVLVKYHRWTFPVEGCYLMQNNPVRRVHQGNYAL